MTKVLQFTKLESLLFSKFGLILSQPEPAVLQYHNLSVTNKLTKDKLRFRAGHNNRTIHLRNFARSARELYVKFRQFRKPSALELFKFNSSLLSCKEHSHSGVIPIFIYKYRGTSAGAPSFRSKLSSICFDVLNLPQLNDEFVFRLIR